MMIRLMDCSALDDGMRSLLQKFGGAAYTWPNPGAEGREGTVGTIARTDVKSPRELCSLAFENGGTMIGGLLADWYADCGCLFVIRIAVDPAVRGHGVGSLLMREGLRLMKVSLGQSVRYVFAEAEMPCADTWEGCGADAEERLEIWRRWGAYRIPITHVRQSSPKKEGEITETVLLTLRCFAGNDGRSVEAETLKRFLKALCRESDHEDSRVLQDMEAEVDSLSAADGFVQGERLPKLVIGNAPDRYGYGYAGYM